MTEPRSELTPDYAAMDRDELAAEVKRLADLTHECQNGCGRRVAVILTDLDDHSTDLLCHLCHLAMMLAIAQDLPDPASLPAQEVDPSPAVT